MDELRYSIVLRVLNEETNGHRFEDFCDKLISEDEQKTFLRTSRNYDQQRDGKAQDDSGEYICSGATDDTATKAHDDIKGLLEKTKNVQRVIICSRSTLTEYAEDKVKNELCKKFPQIPIISIRGAIELAQLAVTHKHIFSTYYHAEYLEAVHLIDTAHTLDGENELNGLRIALTTQLHQDAQSLRSDIVSHLILTSLRYLSAATIREISKYTSHSLKLPSTIDESWFIHEVHKLREKGLVEEVSGRYSLTAKGISESIGRDASNNSYSEKFEAAISEAIEELTGNPLSAGEKAAIWKVFEEGITALFLAHGATVIRSIQHILETESEIVAEHSEDLRSSLRQLCDRISALPGGGQRITEISQAISDLFLTPGTPVFEYLSRIAEVFITLCSLGFDPKAQSTIIEVITGSELVLDTDMILSILSPGESNHSDILTLIDSWRKKGGKSSAPLPALEEASHHAFVAQRDFDENEYLLAEDDPEDALRYVSNVFVRGFYHECSKKKMKRTRTRWGRYIAMFRGASDHDSRKIESLLRDRGIDCNGDCVEDKTTVSHFKDIVFSNRVKERHVHTSEIHGLREKSERDARTALILKEKSLASDRYVILLSTSGAVRFALKLVGATSENGPMIWYLPSLAWVLAQCPGVSANETTLRRVLFNVDIQNYLTPLERKCLRTLRLSEEYEFRWSRRASLMDAVHREIKDFAKAYAVDTSVIEDRIVNAKKDDTMPAELLARAVDSISQSKSEKLILDLKKQLKRGGHSS